MYFLYRTVIFVLIKVKIVEDIRLPFRNEPSLPVSDTPVCGALFCLCSVIHACVELSRSEVLWRQVMYFIIIQEDVSK